MQKRIELQSSQDEADGIMKEQRDDEMTPSCERTKMKYSFQVLKDEGTMV